MVDNPRPTVAVGCFVFNQHGQLMLIQRGKQPGYGLWTIPGGRVEYGEKLVVACQREVFEETGIEVTIGDMVTIFEPVSEGFHYVIIDYLGTPVVSARLDPIAGDDAMDVRWVNRNDISDLDLTKGLIPIVTQAWKQFCLGMEANN
ncbi:MAG: NUDIX hydrolase [Immundisolibacteraceae bacterium]|nr:NUDIX hydrolase [Immundisolibacteraceae bacterium]